MRKFEVGQLFEEGKTRYREGSKFNFQQSGANLYLFFSRPTDAEIQSIKSGKFELGFYEKEPAILMLFKFAGMNMMDAPYSVHLSSEFEFQELGPGLGFGLNICLVDASTGILQALRYVGLSTDFSMRFQKAVERQKNIQFNEREYDMHISNIYRNYTTTDLAQRADAWCRIK